jgi:hypothetical protein
MDFDISIGHVIKNAGFHLYNCKRINNMKKIQILRITGLMLITCPVILTNQNISDISKGLLMGTGIGMLVLSLIVKNKKVNYHD